MERHSEQVIHRQLSEVPAPEGAIAEQPNEDVQAEKVAAQREYEVEVYGEILAEEYNQSLSAREELKALQASERAELMELAETLNEMDSRLQSLDAFIYLYEKTQLGKTPEVTLSSTEALEEEEELRSIGYHFKMQRKVKHGGHIDASLHRHRDNRHFTIKKGSKIADDITTYAHDAVERDRRKYASYINEEYVLLRDITFNSVSSATAFVIGRSADGFKIWFEVETGLPLKNYQPLEWQDKRK